jgi:cation:H+ antiporter
MLAIAVGLVVLLLGAHLLVRGGTGLAAWLGIRPMVIGLTVVSLGTSVPELAVGIDAAVGGSPGLAIGNIVGTNLVNLLLILGLSAVLAPVVFETQTLRFDLPAMTVAAVVLVLVSLDGRLTRADGLLLLAGAVAYTWALVLISRRGGSQPEPVDAPVARPVPDALSLLGGIVTIVVGAELLVDGAVRTADSLGASETVIGLTVVAIGTSAPELVTTLVSTWRGDRAIALGNLLGSSIYNIAFVLGLTVVVAPGGLAVPREVLASDLLLMMVVTLAAIPVFASGRRLSRLEGAAFVAVYLGYLAWLLVTRT